MATGEKDGNRETALEEAIEKGQTLPKLRHVVALILQSLEGPE